MKNKVSGGRHLPPDDSMIGKTAAGLALGLDRRTVGRMLKRGELDAIVIEGVTWLDRRAVEVVALAKRKEAMEALLEKPIIRVVVVERPAARKLAYAPGNGVKDRYPAPEPPPEKNATSPSAPTPPPSPSAKPGLYATRPEATPPRHEPPPEQEVTRIRPAPLDPSVYAGWVKNNFKSIEDLELEQQPPHADKSLDPSEPNHPDPNEAANDGDSESESHEEEPKSRRHG